ncbi:hypothetical protein LTR86_003974 [Recurvomyces mirabilis]|nr:hypothetical protein LTR86_003974 [Recurvomyces mirabilis]
MYRMPRALTLRQHPLFRPRATRQRNLSLLPRRSNPATLYRPSGEPVRYQAVRFRKAPFFTQRRLLVTALYAGVIYLYMTLALQYLVVEIEIVPESEADEKRKQENGQEGEEMTEEDEEDLLWALDDSTFVPMTWAKKLPRSFYKGSDPEWQEFVKVAKDKSRHKKIQNELVQIVYAGSIKHPMIARQLGKDMKVGKYWLDISFPDGPPQEYERYGVEIGDDFIAWSKQKVSQENHWRLTRALWPTATAESLWATTKVLAGIQYRRAKQALGWEGKDPFSPEERYKHAMDLLAKQQQARERKEVGNTQTPDGSTPTGTVVTSTNSSATPDTTKPTTASSPSDKKLPWTLSVPMPNVSSLGTATDLPIAMHVFNHALSKNWNPKKAEPPRGTFVVQGLVEIRGQRGRMLFDVQSAYDPKAGKYVAVNAGARNFKKWNQAPKGGS